MIYSGSAQQLLGVIITLIEDDVLMVSSYRIRSFKPEDLGDVERINRIFLPENYPSYFFMENYRRFPNSFLVAETDDGKVVGYVMCRVEPHYAKSRTLVLGHVLSIAVSKEHRGRGIGEALMLKAEEGLLTYGSEAIYLEVRVSNEPAIRLYEKLGYKKLGIIPFYYADGEDAFLMYKVVKAGLDDSLIHQALGRRVTS